MAPCCRRARRGSPNVRGSPFGRALPPRRGSRCGVAVPSWWRVRARRLAHRIACSGREKYASSPSPGRIPSSGRPSHVAMEARTKSSSISARARYSSSPSSSVRRVESTTSVKSSTIVSLADSGPLPDAGRSWATGERRPASKAHGPAARTPAWKACESDRRRRPRCLGPRRAPQFAEAGRIRVAPGPSRVPRRSHRRRRSRRDSRRRRRRSVRRVPRGRPALAATASPVRRTGACPVR